MLSEINLYPGGQASKQINNSKLVSFTFYTSVNKSREEFSVKLLEPGKEISVMVPRKQPEVERHPTHDKLHTSKFKLHKFVILDNSSAVTIETKPELPVEVEMYVKVGGEPNPSQGEFDFNITLSAGRTNSLNSTIPSSSYEYLLSNDVLNWTAAGNYSVMVRYKLPENRSFTEDQLGDGIGYNFSVYTSSCLYHDPKTNIWRTDGVKVLKLITILIVTIIPSRSCFTFCTHAQALIYFIYVCSMKENVTTSQSEMKKKNTKKQKTSKCPELKNGIDWFCTCFTEGLLFPR